MSIHISFSAHPDCPRPDLCYGEICVAPHICHDLKMQADPEAWKAKLDELAAEFVVKARGEE